MGMGIVSDKDFEAERKDSEVGKSEPKPRPSVVIPMVEKGRGTGNFEVPNSLRNIIGETAAVEGRQAGIALAREFGIGPSSVSAYTNGATSTASYDKTPNKEHINDAKQRVGKRARAKLMKALNKLTDDKLDAVNAKDLSGIAKDMAVISKAMDTDDGKSNSGNTVNATTFVVYAPQHKTEEHYDVVHAKE